MTRITKIIIVFTVIFVVIIKLDINFNNKEISNIGIPIQNNLDETIKIVHEGKDRKYMLDGLAEYEISAVVKGKKKYSTDRASSVSKYDLALVWGQLDDKQIDEHIKYGQTGRWYYFRYDSDTHVDEEYISRNSANVHIIAKDKDILNKIARLNKEDYITLKGYLVNVRMTGGDWTSSLSRTDIGDGACEIMYVEEVEIN